LIDFEEIRDGALVGWIGSSGISIQRKAAIRRGLIEIIAIVKGVGNMFKKK
jgi:hypothetical protein